LIALQKIAIRLGLSTSAYSKIESGVTQISIKRLNEKGQKGLSHRKYRALMKNRS
jgi:transcriptional regulator with XRE-family HTH domain